MKLRRILLALAVAVLALVGARDVEALIALREERASQRARIGQVRMAIDAGVAAALAVTVSAQAPGRALTIASPAP